jgi:hypothetical protein
MDLDGGVIHNEVEISGHTLQTPLVMDYSPIQIHTSRPMSTLTSMKNLLKTVQKS